MYVAAVDQHLLVGKHHEYEGIKNECYEISPTHVRTHYVQDTRILETY